MKLKEEKLKDLVNEGFIENDNEYLYEIGKNKMDIWILKDRTVYIEVLQVCAFHSEDLEIIDRLYKKGFMEEEI